MSRRRRVSSGGVQRGQRKTTPRVKDGRVQRKNHRDVWSGEAGPLRVETEVPGPGYRHVVSEALLREFMALVPDWEQASRGLRTVILTQGSEQYDGYYGYGDIELRAWPDPPARSVGPWQFAERRALWERLGIRWRDAPEMVAELELETYPMPGIDRQLRDVYDDFDLDIEEAGEDAWVARDRSAPGRPVICDIVQVDYALYAYERRVFVQFDRRTAADYTLLSVFLRYLGHHVDAITPPRKGRLSRGDEFAELWAQRAADAMWDAWVGRR
jgi:hypothetical protein